MAITQSCHLGVQLDVSMPVEYRSDMCCAAEDKEQEPSEVHSNMGLHEQTTPQLHNMVSRLSRFALQVCDAQTKLPPSTVKLLI